LSPSGESVMLGSEESRASCRTLDGNEKGRNQHNEGVWGDWLAEEVLEGSSRIERKRKCGKKVEGNTWPVKKKKIARGL